MHKPFALGYNFEAKHCWSNAWFQDWQSKENHFSLQIKRYSSKFMCVGKKPKKSIMETRCLILMTTDICLISTNTAVHADFLIRWAVDLVWYLSPQQQAQNRPWLYRLEPCSPCCNLRHSVALESDCSAVNLVQPSWYGYSLKERRCRCAIYCLFPEWLLAAGVLFSFCSDCRHIEHNGARGWFEIILPALGSLASLSARFTDFLLGSFTKKTADSVSNDWGLEDIWEVWSAPGEMEGWEKPQIGRGGSIINCSSTITGKRNRRPKHIFCIVNSQLVTNCNLN